MLHQNFTHYIGRLIDTALPLIEGDFFGTVVVLAPGEVIDASVKPSRLQVFIDDQGIITKIVNG